MPNREQFEAAYRAAFPSHGFNTSNLFVAHDGLYGHAHIQVAWLWWQAGAAAERERTITVADQSQDWKGMDGTTAFHLITRHADGWADVGKMMGEWLEANRDRSAP